MLRLLVVDDEILTREGIVNGLPWDKMGIGQVLQADDGTSAWAIASQSKPDILLTDVRMPVLDGISLSQTIRKRWPKTRTIILTGYKDFSDLHGALRARVVEYLFKPVDPAELEAVIRRVSEEPDADTAPAAPGPGGEGEAGESRWAIQQAVRLVKTRIAQPPTLTELAELGKLNPSYFSTQFKRAMGMNYVDYLKNCRIEEATRLLKESEMHIYEIGAAVGYHDVKHFSIVFKEITGLTPLAYRQR